MEINMNQLAIKDPAIHGTALKPLQVYHQDYLFGGLLVPYHWHEEWEWIWVEDGEINITIAGKQLLHIKMTFYSLIVRKCMVSVPLIKRHQFTMRSSSRQKF